MDGNPRLIFLLLFLMRRNSGPRHKFLRVSGSRTLLGWSRHRPELSECPL